MRYQKTPGELALRPAAGIRSRPPFADAVGVSSPRAAHATVLVVLAAVAISAIPGAAQERSGSIAGRVLDTARQPIGAAAVTLSNGQVEPRTSLADTLGNYRFGRLTPGTYTLRAQRLGFVAAEVRATVTGGESRTLDIVLTPDTLALPEVVAAGRSAERVRFEEEAGVTARIIDASMLKTLPGLGEADVLRAVELLPGVISTSDFSSAFNVRGGSADQNLILLDGFPVFNPFHLGGVFSVFNSDAVDRAELLAGGFGAEFGGRVSSVLNIESRDERPEGMEVTGGISLIASRILLRGSVPDVLGRAASGGSWFISARRSYLDQILRPIAEFPYHLSDLQGRVSLETRGGGRIGITAYLGDDVLDLSNFGLSNQGTATDILRLRWNWGNRVIGASWDQPLPDAWQLSTRVGYTAFSEHLRFIDFGDVRFDNRIEQVLLRSDVRREFSDRLQLQMGLGADLTGHTNLAEAGGTSFFDSDGKGALGSAYAAFRWRPASRWIVEPGLRIDLWTSSDTTRAVLSPRFAAKRFFGAEENIALKLAVGRYSQFVHSLRDEELPVSNDTWVLADRSVPHLVSDQVQAGIEAFWPGGWSASLEVYGRRFDGVTEFNLVEDPNDAADDLLAGEATSFGLDILVRRSEGSLTGWAALSLLRADQTFPEPLAEGWDDLPQTVSYPPVYDRRVNLDLVGRYRTRSGVEIGARWNFGTGLPYSRPLAQYFSWRHHPLFGRSDPLYLGPERDGMPVAVVLGPRNRERYPPYHRLDLTVRKTFERSWGSFVPYLQVLNVYNRRNVLFYFYDYNRAPPTRSGFSMFPILPAAGIEVAF
jgi:hypothetical protein